MIERNKRIVVAYVAAMNAGDWSTLRRLFHTDATIQGVTGTLPIEAALAEGSIWHQLHEGLNLRLHIDSMIAEGDMVATRYVETGTWTGTFLDKGVPSGRSYRLVAMEWFELPDGSILRRWGARDAASQAQQLGFAA